MQCDIRLVCFLSRLVCSNAGITVCIKALKNSGLQVKNWSDVEPGSSKGNGRKRTWSRLFRAGSWPPAVGRLCYTPGPRRRNSFSQTHHKWCELMWCDRSETPGLCLIYLCEGSAEINLHSGKWINTDLPSDCVTVFASLECLNVQCNFICVYWVKHRLGMTFGICVNQFHERSVSVPCHFASKSYAMNVIVDVPYP